MAKAKELSKRPKEETETPERTETLLSLDGLRKYECISEKQKEEACKALRVVPQSVKEHITAVTSSSQVGGTEFLFWSCFFKWLYNYQSTCI